MEVAQRGSVLAAADIAIGDQYGISCALSGNGDVLAVGSDYWEGASNNQGGVYIYDRSGSSWTQRGAVLVATDAASNYKFGHGVALSDDGTVLAVATVAAGVYVYDWSGSAWVLRGVKIASTIATSVALSSDGNTLVVGIPNYSAVYANGGLVRTYAWSGSAWVEAAGAVYYMTANAFFGWSVALSADAMVLAVGATGDNIGAGASSGSVYVYDWNGSGWTIRLVSAHGSVAYGNFGTGVALSGDASTLVIGEQGWYADSTHSGRCHFYDLSASALTLGSTIFSPGTPEAGARFGCSVAIDKLGRSVVVGEYSRDTPVADEGALYTFDGTLFTGVSVASTLLSVTLPVGGPSIASTRLTVSHPHGASVASTRLTVYASGPSVAATLLSVLAPGHVASWTAACRIDGADVSSMLTGVATVTADEGAARIARLTLKPPSGTIVPLDYVGKLITLDYVLLIAGVPVNRRLFTGRVDTPDYDPNSCLLRLSCTDDLQNRVAALPRGTIDALVGGRYTEAVQDSISDNWDYALARLSTVAGSLDASSQGGMRVTPWQIAAPWATFGVGDLLYDKSVMTLPQRSTLVNQVAIEFDYRYPRLRQRYASVGWSGTHIDMLPAGYQYPVQADFLAAAGGSGWTVTRGIFSPAPATIPHSSGGYVVPNAGAIDMAIMLLAQRHSQTVEEAYRITVKAPESITANGMLPASLRGALESAFSGSAWESALDVAPLMAAAGDMDYMPDAPRIDAEYAIQTLLDQANVRILGSHRSARVINSVLCNPELDLDKRIAISTPQMVADGKVASVVHTLDFTAGSAVTEFGLAVFGAGGAGIITPTTLLPPDAPAPAVETQDWAAAAASLTTSVFGVTPYQPGLMGLLINPPPTISVKAVPVDGDTTFPNPYFTAGSYPETGFRVAMPGVDDADRNPIVKPVDKTYNVVIPAGSLSFTIP
ncbi:MAG: FG-GAP repeat protein [Nevskia sp.]|jgi:hypothetical protein|nr:FG-GAP repeat protein [Nevskia sp.]